MGRSVKVAYAEPIDPPFADAATVLRIPEAVRQISRFAR